MARVRKRVARFLARKLDALFSNHKRTSRRSSKGLTIDLLTQTQTIPTTTEEEDPVPSSTSQISIPAITPFHFLALPIELQLEVIEILQSYLQIIPNTPGWNPLIALSLTCKSLRKICIPFTCSKLSLTMVDLPRMDRLLSSATQLGAYVHDLEIIIPEQGSTNADLWEIRTIKMLKATPNLRSLIIHHPREEPNRRHPLLLHFISGLQHLEHVTIRELHFDPGLDLQYTDMPQDEVFETFFHELLMTILNAHASKLRSLILYTLLPLHEAAFLKLRDRAVTLETLWFTTNISVTLRPLFTLPKQWACANTLKHLTFHECGGAHIGSIGTHVSSGTFGQLKSLDVVACGDPSDELPASYPSTDSKIPPLEHVHIDHVAPWEVRALTSIPTRSLSFTRSPVETVLELNGIIEENRWWGGSLEKVKLLLSGVDEYDYLTDTCTRMNLAVTTDARSWGKCHCHPDA